MERVLLDSPCYVWSVVQKQERLRCGRKRKGPLPAGARRIARLSKIRFAVLKEQEDLEISTSMLIYIVLSHSVFVVPLSNLCFYCLAWPTWLQDYLFCGAWALCHVV